MQEMILEITQEDIDNGVPKNGTHCAIAKAAYRALGERFRKVSSNAIEFSDGSGWTTFAFLPLKAQRFMRDFDAGRKRRPLSFQVQINHIN